MKNFRNYFVIAFTCIALLGSSTLFAQEWSKDQKEVWQTVENGWAAWASGNMEGAFDGIHDKYLGWNNERPLPMSKAKWQEMYKKYSEFMKVQYYDLEPARIVVEGDNAIVYYYFSFYSVFEMGDIKEEEDVKGRNVEFYVKDGGNWLMMGDMSYYEENDDDDDD